MFGFAAVMFIISAIFVPETYAPVLLRRKAAKLQKESNGEVRYMSAMDYANTKTTAEIFKISMTRPFVLLFKEPIVLALSIYCAIIYGILYMFFAVSSPFVLRSCVGGAHADRGVFSRPSPSFSRSTATGRLASAASPSSVSEVAWYLVPPSLPSGTGFTSVR
jgi:hypothetical protein